MGYKSVEEKREYQRRWVANRRAEFFADKTCVICGSVENLELDHKERDQKVSHRIWSWSRERMEAEAAKCQVLCSDCHKSKTKLEWLELRSHGRTLYGHGCRCSICCEAQRRHRANDAQRERVVKLNNGL